MAMNRIEWVDVFKGLLIISMVVGHATGYFNKYIYQFHMAAFFFASGYTINLSKRTLRETIYHKAYTILLPYLTSFVLILIFYKIVWRLNPDVNINVPFDKSVMSNGTIWFIKEFIFGNTTISAMGATWFLPVLFFSTIFAKMLSMLSIVKKYILLSLIIPFALSYLLLIFLPGIIHVPHWFIDLSMLALLFMEFGIVVRNYNIIEKIDPRLKWVLFIVTLFGLHFFANVAHVVMDWPIRKFGALWIDVFAVLNDVYLTIVIAQILSKVEWIKNFIVFIGKNTMGILLFHFLSFKVAYYILGESIENFLPPAALNGYELFVCVFTAIFVSITLWKLLLLNPYLRYAFGQKVRIS